VKINILQVQALSKKMEKRQKYVCSYDQAGNLVKTVPPAGVNNKHSDAIFLQQVAAARLNVKNGQAEALNKVVPTHTLVTDYRYNSLNQVVAQKTPDAGKSTFWYDQLGRLAVSQNSQQLLDKKYSYTLYDALGRITEVGQKPQTELPPTKTPDLLQKWLAGGGLKEQITRTSYDLSYYDGKNTLKGFLEQRNLRNRVSYSMVFDKEPDPDVLGTHSAGTFYSYDIHGNVDTLLQDFNEGVMKATGNRFKKIAYDYDLISGKVNKVSYQADWEDEFYHKYFYDAENRLTDVYSSTNGLLWQKDARYSYYRHGPLAKTILGQNQVQGIDYAYTLQGWLKGVNSTAVDDGKFDMGEDGLNAKSLVARDAFGFGLHYFGGDYKAINNTVLPFAPIPNLVSLYNGNIAAMSVNIPKVGEPLLNSYRYDQLNRLTKVNTYKGLNPQTNNWNVVAIDDHREELTYDANGNIQTYKRNGWGNNLNLNNYSYTYQDGTNKLTSLKNIVDNKIAAYGYDAIGNVIKDEKQNVLNNIWNVYGKLQKVEKKDGKIITYSYDAAGNRISKTVGDTTEIYVRDAAGNVMLTYQKNPLINNNHLSTKEFYKYGSNLLGIKKNAIDVSIPKQASAVEIFVRGEDEYYLYDHRGNVVGSVSDNKIQHDDNNDGVIDYYTADVRTATYYSSYGAMSKSFNGDSMQFGHNGQRLSPEISPTAQTAEFWEYNADIGRRSNLDPRPNPSISPYAAFDNNPIWNIDPLGDTIVPKVNGGSVDVDPGRYHTFDGNTHALQNSSKTVQPAAGTLRDFTITGENLTDGSIRFVAQFGAETGNFKGYFWDKKPSVSYEDFASEGEQIGRSYANHVNDPMWDASLSADESRKNTLNWGLGAVLPNPIFKTATAAANVPKGTGLPEITGKTFRFGRYTETVLEKPITLSRYYDNVNAFAKGRFMTNSTSSFTFVDRMRMAIRPSWNNMTKVAQWEIPAGSIIYQGKAAMQFPWIGGKTQYFIPELENIKRVIPK
jgi:YD repeat-containing protein